MPTLRGFTTDNSFGSWPIPAVTGTATDDVIDLIIVDDNTVDSVWVLGSGTGHGAGTVLVSAGVSGWRMTVIRVTITGTAPSGFTPTNTNAPSFWHATCVAWEDADETNTVVGTVYNANPATTDPLTISGIDVDDDGSLVAAYTTERFGTLAISSFTTINSSDTDLYYDPFDSGPTGGVSGTPSNGFQPIIAVLISVPPVGGADGTATPATIAATVSIDAAAASAGSSTSPATIAVTAAIDAAAASAGSSTSPATIIATAALDAVAASAGSSTAPATIIAPVSLDAVTATGGGSATASPESILVAAALDAVTPSAGATVTVSEIVALASFDATTAQGEGSATATPNTIAVVVALDQAAASAGSTVSPTTIQVLAVIPAAFATGGGAAVYGYVIVTIAQPTVTLEVETPTVTVAIDAPSVTLEVERND